ncbi:MAG: leucine-rich repeat protein, partial [Clostridia bacterium]|nr:leucine-rich repeat protein [Clostridia bacterium]
TRYGCTRCNYTVYNFTLNADDNSYTLSAFGADFRNYAMKNDGNIVLPSTVNGLSVTAVGVSDATTSLISTSQIKTLTIPASVKSIGNNAFSGCSGLTNIYFEENSQLETIGARAFANCTALPSVEIPKSVITLGEQAFSMPKEGNGSLAEVTFEEGSQLKTIGNYAFSSCIQLTTIEIPENVTTITYGAFENCTSLDTVTFAGDKVTYFGSAIFYGCTSLKNIDIPSTLTTLGKQAFRDCTSLESVVIPAGIVSPVQGIDDATFVGCTSLKQVVILCELQTIKICSENGVVLDAFDGCTALTDVFYAYSKEQMSTVGNIGNIKAFENVTFHYNTTSAHEYTVVTDEAVAPTCTETGLTEGSHCSVCNTVFVAQETVDALGHEYGNATYYLANEAENLVAYGQQCTRCGEWKLLNYATYHQLNNVYSEDEMRLLLEHGYGARAQADIVITSPIEIYVENINDLALDEEGNLLNSTIDKNGNVTKGTDLVYLNVNANNHIISTADNVEAMFITNTRLNLTNGSKGTTDGKFIANEYIVINRGINYSNATQFTTAEFISNGDAIIKLEGSADDKSGSFALLVSGNFVANGSNPTMLNIDEYSNAYQVYAAHILAGTYYNWNPNTAPVLIDVAHTATP